MLGEVAISAQSQDPWEQGQCPSLPRAAESCLCGLLVWTLHCTSDVSDCVSFVILTMLIVLLMGEYVGSICWIFCEGKKIKYENPG